MLGIILHLYMTFQIKGKIMKKYKILILILVIAVVFTSCITKKDIEEKENIMAEAEQAFETIQDNFDELEKEYTELSNELDTITKSNEEIKNNNISTAEEIEELKKDVPNPPFLFLEDEFIDNLQIIIDDSKKADMFKRALENEIPDKTQLDNDNWQYVYELKGDKDSDKYITLTIIAGDDYHEVYDIIVEYSGDIYKDDYDKLVDAVLATVVMITDDPYNYNRDQFDAAKEFLDEGNYFNKFMWVEQETDAEITTTRVFCRNY